MVSSFKSFLVEEQKTVYFVWGRMNPPTAGHEMLLDFAKQKAGNNPLRIFLTQTNDGKRNPLDYKTKIKFARKGFPKYARQIVMNPKIKLMLEAITAMYDEGFKKLVIIAGEDRVREYDVLANKYNGKKSRHGFYNFESITVLNAGQRDPDAEGVEGVSGTKLREFAKFGDFTKFAQLMPKALSNAEAKVVFNSVRQGLGLTAMKETTKHIQLQSVSDIREDYIKGTLFTEGEQVVIKKTDEVVTIKTLGSNYIIVEDNNSNIKRMWLDAVEKIEPRSEDIELMNNSVELIRNKIAREKEIEKRRDKADARRHDKLIDRARMAKTRSVNRRTQGSD